MSEKEFLIQGSLLLQPIEESEHPLMLKDRWHGEDDLGQTISKFVTCSETNKPEQKKKAKQL